MCTAATYQTKHFYFGRNLDYELLPYMKEAAAVISEEISAEGHTATVGLLLHKPVIIGAVQATRRLQDGVTVSVDCSRGIVQIMPQ